MKTPCTAPSPSTPAKSMSPSHESTCRPKALRRTVMSIPPMPTWSAVPSTTRSASRIMPAHDPNAGMPPATRFCSGSSRSNVTSSLPIVVDSPPGTTIASTESSSWGRRTRTARAPAASRTATCSRTSPCNASTPMVGVALFMKRGLPAALGESMRHGQRVDRDADHCLAETARDLGDDVGVVVHRRGLDNGAGPLRRVARLEDAAADEHALGAELHHQRGVRGRRDAAGGEQHDRELALLCDLLDQVVRRLQLLGGHEQLVALERAQPADLPADRAHVGDGVR